MSISSRSTKAAMYSEIERLRAVLDLRNNLIAAQWETIRRLEAKIEELSASRPAPQPSAAPLSDRNTRHEMMKRLAITCKASVKWVDGQGFRQYKNGSWVFIPTHIIDFVAKGISQ